jgi:20S proteasome alpha/beta subunit
MQRLTASGLFEEAQQSDEITNGTGKEIESVTLVIALPGKDCIVIGSDTYAFVGDEQAYVGYKCRKIGAFANRWIIGSAETSTGSTLLSRLDNSDFQGDYWSVLDTCRTKTKQMYEDQHYIQGTSFLLCGLHNGVPKISKWHLPSNPGGRTIEHVAEAIGIPGYGMHLANAYLGPDMSEEQLKLLAQFCVLSMVNQDLRVRGPIEVGVVNKDGARIYEPAEMSRYAEEANRIYKSIGEKFLKFT